MPALIMHSNNLIHDDKSIFAEYDSSAAFVYLYFTAKPTHPFAATAKLPEPPSSPSVLDDLLYDWLNSAENASSVATHWDRLFAN